MKMFRYMVGEVRAGGCVTASSHNEANEKVRAFYDGMVSISDSYKEYRGADIQIWDDGDGFNFEFPDVVEVYP